MVPKSLTPGATVWEIAVLEPKVGFEPTTDGLRNRCSTTELLRPDVGGGRILAADRARRSGRERGEPSPGVHSHVAATTTTKGCVPSPECHRVAIRGQSEPRPRATSPL